MAQAAHPFRIGGPAAASLLVNGLLIAVLLNLGMGHVSRRSEAPALTVLSLAQLKGTEQGEEEAETATPSTPAPVQPPTARQPPAPQPTARITVTPPVVAVPSHLSLSMPMPAAAPTANPSAAPSSPALQATAAVSAALIPRRGGAEGLDVKAPPGTSRSYAAKVRSWLYAHKIYPRLARMRRKEGRVEVRFVLDRAGMLLEGAIVQGSGNTVLDDEAEAMLRRASPYPRAPAELPGERIEFTAPIIFTLPA
ncbi:energy transducer TonB [Sphingobium sp. HBC34]|uniref:Energy transducer TonB n=1 Tax=Sphingobium cyanobacteriorum TaxID=3063954 RepID=A0ABT8ZSG7_9SPHN|nr:energy transducer TonB [Sphingobium sp. HBC34]MDO7837479.1 energy transducer TonB [Sphingobium sp. HBC34]